MAGDESLPKWPHDDDKNADGDDEKADSVTMRRFTGKTARRVGGDDPKVVINSYGDHSPEIRLNKAARELVVESKYVDYYIAKDESMVGLKPVSGGDVTEDSYKLTGGQSMTVSFGSVATELRIDTSDSWELDAEWSDDEGMLVIDISGLPREGDQ